MTTILLETLINAPIERCFDLARDIDFHQLSTSKTKEKVVAGKMTGLCEEGEVITWEAIHFGIRQRLTIKITKVQRPHYFEDEMVRGAFSMMRHKHSFLSEKENTCMKDEFIFKAPLGILGRFAELLFLKRYMTGLLKERNRVLKAIAESS